MPKKVLLLYGGYSAERNISISSAENIYTALTQKGHTVIKHDLTDIWQFLEVVKKEKPNVIFNGLYGNWGEDGTIQGLLDLLQIPYTHSGLKASALGMDKRLTKILASERGVKVAKGYETTMAEFQKNGTNFPYPYVVKPVSDGSSVGVFIVHNADDAQKVHYDDNKTPILIEKYITGQELTCMCLNGKSYVVTELKASNEFYDYEAKYTDGFTQHILPAQIPNEVAETCKRYSEIVFHALECNAVARCDFRYNPNDGVVLLEINTNPGMTALSLVPEQAKYAGISYADLCDLLVQKATFRSK